MIPFFIISFQPWRSTWVSQRTLPSQYHQHIYYKSAVKFQSRYSYHHTLVILTETSKFQSLTCQNFERNVYFCLIWFFDIKTLYVADIYSNERHEWNNGWLTMNIFVSHGVICWWIARLTQSRVKIISESPSQRPKNHCSRYVSLYFAFKHSYKNCTPCSGDTLWCPRSQVRSH